MKYNKLVRTFMGLMGQDMPETPTVPHPNIQTLRHELIREENNELSMAADAGDIIEVADALCDLRYVVEGAMAAYGFSPELMDELFEEVQRSNMSKVCSTPDEARATEEKYFQQEPPIPVHTTRIGDKYVVARISDNKVLKSVNYSEPDLRSILERHGVKC